MIKEKTETKKLPMYYEQISDLMRQMNSHHIDGYTWKFFQTTKQLYSRIRIDLSKEQQQKFDDELKSIYHKLQNLSPTEKIPLLNTLTYNFEVKLFEIMNELGIFSILKTQCENERKELI